jgi:hypothetical protein
MSNLWNDPIGGSDAPLGATAAFLCKLAKHLALIGCLMIVGVPSGRETIGQLTVFFTIVLAALLHGIGRHFQQRRLRRRRLSLLRHER